MYRESDPYIPVSDMAWRNGSFGRFADGTSGSGRRLQSRTTHTHGRTGQTGKDQDTCAGRLDPQPSRKGRADTNRHGEYRHKEGEWIIMARRRKEFPEATCPSGTILAGANIGFPPKTSRFAVVAMCLVLMLAAVPCPGAEGSSESRDQLGLNLIYAAATDNCNEVMALLAKGADINFQESNGESAIMAAAYSGHAKAVKLLIKKGANVNVKDDQWFTPLICAAMEGHLEVVKLLIAAGAHVNDGGYYYSTPLKAAIAKGYLEITKLLISEGVDINENEEDIGPPINTALGASQLEIAELLIQKGARLDLKDSEGQTPLFYAVSKELVGMAKLMIEKGADVNAKDANGRTVLMEAARRNLEIAKLLVEKGSDVNARDNDGQTARGIADEAIEFSIADYLEKHGAK